MKESGIWLLIASHTYKGLPDGASPGIFSSICFGVNSELRYQAIATQSNGIFINRFSYKKWDGWTNCPRKNVDIVSTSKTIDFDSFIEDGVHYISSSGSYSHYPLAGKPQSGYLIVISRSKEYGLQIFYPASKDCIYFRLRMSANEDRPNGWMPWVEVGNSQNEAKYSQNGWLAGLFNDTFEKSTIPIKTVANGMPYIKSGVKEGDWPTYPKGAVIAGLPYSSVFNSEGDIFYNRSLATYYSAVKNPYSVLYKKRGGVPHDGNNGTRACYYGVVCSSFVEYLFGDPLYRVSRELTNFMEKIDVKTYFDLEVGTLFVSPTHTILLSDLYYTNGSSINMKITEAVGPIIREVVYKGEDEVNKFLTERIFEGDYNAYRYPKPKMAPLKLEPYAEDVIFEYGNNTWYKIGSAIKVYVTNGAKTLYYKKSTDKTYKSLPISTKNVNLTSYLKSAGTWYVTTDVMTDLPAKVIVVDLGKAKIDKKCSVVTLSGYSNNVKPLTWHTFIRNTAISEYEPKDRDNRVITIDTDHYGYIIDGSNHFMVTHSASNKDYLIRIYWDTGCGQCRSEVYAEDF